MNKPPRKWYRLDNAGLMYSSLQQERYSAIYRISAVMDYFEIFLERMILCRKAAEKLGMKFVLRINGQKLM